MISIHKIKEYKNKALEEHFFRPHWYSIFVNPYFINRYGLYQATKRFARALTEDDKVLDVGCGIKPYKHLFKTAGYTGIDIQGGGHADSAKVVDAYYDGLHIPFGDATFTALMCTQVLEHANDPYKLVSDCARVLSPSGKIYVTMPFTYPEHETPYDFRRFTRFQHQKLLEENGFINIQILKTTGFFGTFSQLLVIFLFEGITFRATALKTLLSMFIFSIIQMLGLFLDFITKKAGQTMDYVVIAEKK